MTPPTYTLRTRTWLHTDTFSAGVSRTTPDFWDMASSHQAVYPSRLEDTVPSKRRKSTTQWRDAISLRHCDTQNCTPAELTAHSAFATSSAEEINPLNAELNPICLLLALVGAHHIFHVSGLTWKTHQSYFIFTRPIKDLNIQAY